MFNYLTGQLRHVMIVVYILVVVGTALIINVEQKSNDDLNIMYHDNNNGSFSNNVIDVNVLNCKINDTIIHNLPIICPNAYIINQIDTLNFQLPMPIDMLEFKSLDDNYTILISNIDYNEYYWVLEINKTRAGVSCRRSVIHKYEMMNCLNVGIENVSYPQNTYVFKEDWLLMMGVILCLTITSVLTYKITSCIFDKIFTKQSNYHHHSDEETNNKTYYNNLKTSSMWLGDSIVKNNK